MGDGRTGASRRGQQDDRSQCDCSQHASARTASSACIDLVAQRNGGSTRRGAEVIGGARIQNATRRADDEARAIGGLAVAHRQSNITSLCPDSRHEERHDADDVTDFSQLLRIRRADDQQAIAPRIPVARRKLCNYLVQLAPSRLTWSSPQGPRLRNEGPT